MSNPKNIDINPITSRSYLIGALAGVIGAILMGIVALVLGRILANLTARPSPNTLLEIASIVRSTSPVVGFGLHLVIGAVLGVGFVFLIGSRLQTDKAIILWGFVFGTTWTLIGTLTMLPLLSGAGWNGVMAAFQKASSILILPSLISHAVFGLTLGFLYARATRSTKAILNI
jgi:hypothetical protein